MLSKSVNKLDSPEIKHLFENNDILCFTETWSNKFININVPEFTVFSLNRTDKKIGSKRDSGGIACYVKDSLLNEVSLYKSESDDLIWLKLNKSLFNLEKDVYLCLCYNVPIGSSRQSLIEVNIYDRILTDLNRIILESSNMCNFIVLGDLNSRTGNLNDFVEYDTVDEHTDFLPDDYCSDMFLHRVSQDNTVNQYGNLLLDFCKESGLRITNGRLGKDKNIGKFTFVGALGSSVVDYVLASQGLFELIESFQVHDPNIISDHCTITFGIKGHIKGPKTRINGNIPVGERVDYKFKWNDDKSEQFKNILTSDEIESKLNVLSENLEEIHCDSQVEENIKHFSELLDSICSPFFKVSLCTDNLRNQTDKVDQPWFDDECRAARDAFLVSLNKYRDSSTDENKILMCQKRSYYKRLIRRKRYEMRNSNTKKLLEARINNAREYWKLLKGITCKQSDGSVSANTFAQYFKAINNPESVFYQADDDIIDFNEKYIKGEINIMFEELNVPISYLEVLNSIKQLRNNSSPGPDNILNELLKNSSETVSRYLLKLFNVCLERGFFPDSWSVGHIIPLFKSGDKAEPSNYRGITLLSSLGKLFSRTLNNRLVKWAEKYNVYIEAQAGFRKGMSTIDNIFILNGLISHCLSNNRKLFCAFVDFKKAFDFVVRENLWYKLIKMGVRGKILNVIKSMYECVKSKVKCNNVLSEEFMCTLGVRQGECLSPFLFSMFLNDIEEELIQKGVEGINIGYLNLAILLYADDIILFANSSDALQHSLNVLEEYCLRWKLTVNTEKTKVMIFSNGGRTPSNLVFKYSNNVLEIVRQFKYLGCIFTSGGSFNEMQKNMAGQGLKAIFKLNNYMFHFTSLSPKHSLDLFDKLISPILNYSAEVWGFNKGLSIERTHLRFLKRLLGVKLTTQNNFVYGETGRINFQNRRFIIIIRYWLKLCATDDAKYIKSVYYMLKNDSETRAHKKNWVTHVRDLLSSLGFYEVWLAQGVGDSGHFMKLFKQRISDTFIQKWDSEVKDSSRALFYRTFSSFELQPYLKVITVPKFRIALSKLRMSSHRLEIEYGRWSKPSSVPLNDRLCRHCGVLEDEYHFVIECKLYKELRNKYIKQYFWKHPSAFKFTQLILDSDVQTSKNLSIFVYKAFKIRRNTN